MTNNQWQVVGYSLLVTGYWMLDYLAIGHIAQDLTPDGYRLGGTAAYAALTAHALGLRTGLLTAAAEGALMDEVAVLDVCRLNSPRSTIYENRYTSEGRVQTLRSRAEPLTAAALPRKWQNARIIHLAPIANEVDYALADCFRESFIGLTPQGWMRRWDSGGRVTRGEWAEAAALLNKASAAVISVEDVTGDWELIERWAAESKVFVATEGDRGATIFSQGQRRRFPAPKVDVIDATGAGDIFAACFFVKLWQTGDAWAAAECAIALATDSVTRVGIDGVPTASAINHKPSAIGHPPSATSHQP